MHSSRPAVAPSTALLILAAVIACTDSVAPRLPSVAGSAASRSLSADPVLETFYGPERFVRARGAPQLVTRTISTLRFEAPFVLHVKTGGGSGANAASAATVTFDGATLLGQNDFDNHGGEWAFGVSPGSLAILSVWIGGAPGSTVDIWIEGKRSAPVFCPTGRPGAYATLREAIDAAPVDGTVLVCDGEHIVDTVRIRKPVTIRSEHPGGATIRDADQGPLVLQTGRPSLNIDSVPTGLVRLVDLQFKMSGRSIVTQGSFDQVEIDSSRFVGVDSVSSIPITVFASTVASARVEVTHSHFEHFAIGIFPVAAVETNVRWNVFENSNSAGVTYSSSGSSVAGAFGHAEDNIFKTCGLTGCLRVVTGGRGITIARNTFTMVSGPNRQFGILVRRTNTLTREPVIIEDNEFTGAALTGDPAVNTSWTAQSALQVEDTPGVVHVIRRNRFANTHTGIVVAAAVDAQDNVVTGGAFAFRQTVARAVVIRRNDFIGQLGSFTTVNSAGAYQCNYWGSPTGPRTPPANATPGTYVPWSLEPIAGTTGGTCDPTIVITTIRVCPSAGTSPTFTVSTVAGAVAFVPNGGTVLVCDGTFPVGSLALQKSITITAEGPGMPTLDGGGLGDVMHVNTTGAVVIRGLRFQNTQFANVSIGGTYGTVLIDASEFHPRQGAAYGAPSSFNSGVFAGNAVGGGITIQNSTFIGGDIGVHLNSTSNVVVRGNAFTGQTNAGTHAGNGVSTNIVIDDNTYTDCGLEWCIGMFGGQTTTVTNNRITINAARPTRTPITIALNGGLATIDDNQVIGIGGTGVRTDPNGYGILNNAIQITAPLATVNRNTITNAWAGIAFTPASGTASDNSITHVNAAFSGGGGNGTSNATFQRNDITDYVQEVKNVPIFATLNIRCNWWGSATGPTNTVGLNPLNPSVFTPFSTVPIAKRPDVICTP